MRTLGIDLASRPERTAACLLLWDNGGARVEELRRGLDDDALLSLASRADVVGIDAPFGWPEAFVELVSAHRGGPTAGPDWEDDAARRALRLRRTDRRLWRSGVTGRPPLSVSTDLIALPALRCVGLLHRLGVTDRGGDGRVFEVYPAAALAVWLGRSSGYKGKAGLPVLAWLTDELTRRAPWLDAAGAAPGGDDDRFDALLSALVARAAARGEVEPIPEEDRGVAGREGWIAVPRPGSLDRLPLPVPPASPPRGPSGAADSD